MQTLKTVFFTTGLAGAASWLKEPIQLHPQNTPWTIRAWLTGSRVDMLISSIQCPSAHLPARIQQVFDRFDKDGGGSLDRTELQLLGQC